MDVLFGQAYYLRFDPKLWAARQPYAPLGAMYAAACVRDHGYSVAFFDAMLAEAETEWAAALDRHRPRVAVIYEDNFNYLSKMCLGRMRAAALVMIDAAAVRGIVAIVSGSDASDHPGLYLDRGARVVVRGEGEQTLVEALDALTGRGTTPIEHVPGICLHDGSRRLVQTGHREFIRDLDALPRPAWDLIDVERYRSIWTARHGYFSMNIATTRGCPYHCNWCAKPIYGQRYTARTPESVAAEVAWLKTTFHPDHLWIVDDIFGLKPGWIERFATLVTERDATVPFKCLVRADQVTETVAAALGRAGCRTAWIGAESGSQQVLDAMEKGTRVEQIERATRLLQAQHIEVGFFLQFGYPGETREDIDQTLAMVRACRPDDIGISVSYPLPGTAFHERVRSQLGAKQNWTDSDDLAPLYRATYTPEFYRALHALTHAEFRARNALTGLARLRRVPWRVGPRDFARAVDLVRYAAAAALLRWRVDRLSRVRSEEPTPKPLVILSPHAAAIPSEQPR